MTAAPDVTGSGGGSNTLEEAVKMVVEVVVIAVVVVVFTISSFINGPLTLSSPPLLPG